MPDVPADDAAPWRAAVAAEWASRCGAERTSATSSAPRFPLAANAFGAEELLAMTEVLLSGRLTMGVNVEAAEREFAAAVGAPHAVMVNSGSSANLLMLCALMDPSREQKLERGDAVLVPAVCWSTSVAPMLQLGLKPVFVDVDPGTFNISLPALAAACEANPGVRGLMAVHVLGNSAEMALMLDLARARNLLLIEDACEALGSRSTIGKSPPRMLGTFGEFGAFSFYFSHHITSGEGGMVVCRTPADADRLRRLRAHGWTRHDADRSKTEAAHPDIDPRFLFVGAGFNVRPLEVQGAMLRVQLGKLEEFNACRKDNLSRIEAALKADARFADRMSLMRAAEGTDPAWFGVGLVLRRKYAHQLRAFLAHLTAAGVENRPIVSGNFARQPMVAAAMPGLRPSDFPGAEVLHTRGFFVGVHHSPVSDADVAFLVDALLGFEFRPHHVVLVTGSAGMLGRAVEAEVLRLSNGQRTAQGAPITNGCGLSAVGCDRPPSDDASSTEWFFARRANADLTDPLATSALFRRVQPTQVLHLAASLQSLNEMTARPVEFWLGNVAANNNVLSSAHDMRDLCGPVRVVSVLSTVMFPKDATYPVTASQAEEGTLHPAGESYALAKRALAALTRWYNKEHGEDFSTVLPGNFFGAHGDFGAATAPLVNALIAKSIAAGEVGGDAPLKVMGTGRPLRQLMHARDLARALMWALEHHRGGEPLIVAGPEHSIREIAGMVADAAGFKGGLAFDTDAVDGPLRRTADTSVFEAACPDFRFAPLAESIRETVEWYRANRAKLGD